MTIFVPDPKTRPKYRVVKRKFDRWSEKWLNSRMLSRFLRNRGSSTFGRDSLQTPTRGRAVDADKATVQELRRGVEIKYRLEKRSRKVLTGVIYKRRGDTVTVLCLKPAEVHLLIIADDREDWKNYDAETSQRRLAKLREKFCRNKRLEIFIEKIEDRVGSWKQIRNFPKRFLFQRISP